MTAFRSFILLVGLLVEFVSGGKATCRIEDIRDSTTGAYSVPASCVKLALGGEKLGDDGVVALAESLSKGDHKIAELHVPTTGLGPRGTAALASYLTEAGKGSSLRILNMYGNEVGDEGAKVLAQIFAQNNAAKIPLETLGLGVNAVGATGAAALAHALEDCSDCALKTLGLYRNSVGDEGAAALATMVANNRIALSHLFLGGNSIGNSGAIALADSLKQNNKLKVLSLEGGTVGDSGAVALANALTQSSSTIDTLDIRSCLPTHRNCAHSSLSIDQAAGRSDPNKMSRVGLLALKEAVTARRSSGHPLKAIGDIDFGSAPKKRR